jgi:nudix-type nucleoside diphosphatase (YffH/AdpP family)
MSDDVTSRVRLNQLKTLSDNHYTLRRADFEFQRRDGQWQRQFRESYDIGNAATVLPVDRARGRVILVRQFRWPMFESGYHRLMVEAIAGKLDGDDAQTCVHREAMEEAGVTISNLVLVTDCFFSPGAVKERASVFLAEYDSSAPRQKGGGIAEEAEDIEVLELPLDEAYAMIASGEIVDAKTIILLQAAKLNHL